MSEGRRRAIALLCACALSMSGCGSIATPMRDLARGEGAPSIAAGERVLASDFEDVQDLWLVNGEYGVPGAQPALVDIDGLPLAYSGMQLRPDALAAAQALFARAEERGYGGFVITSAYRTNARQRELYEEAEDKSYVAKPGHSEHETGLAIDVQRMDGSDMGTSLAGRWLHDHAHEFGFVQRYPSDKVDITGISYEPWHLRYVGDVHAAYMRRENLCLEEYIDWLADHAEGADVRLDGVRYRVLRVDPEGGSFPRPQGKIEMASGDNTGGLVLTIRR